MEVICDGVGSGGICDVVYEYDGGSGCGGCGGGVLDDLV